MAAATSRTGCKVAPWHSSSSLRHFFAGHGREERLDCLMTMPSGGSSDHSEVGLSMRPAATCEAWHQYDLVPAPFLRQRGECWRGSGSPGPEDAFTARLEQHGTVGYATIRTPTQGCDARTPLVAHLVNLRTRSLRLQNRPIFSHLRDLILSYELVLCIA